MVGKRAVKYGFILSSLRPVYPPYKSGVKKNHPVPEQTHPRANRRVRPNSNRQTKVGTKSRKINLERKSTKFVLQAAK